ncbi:MAG: hypothetical protein GX558_02125 [Clostridiales bacterium]|nr:hypothetical protein [Clostridiales bacterium]
MAGMDYAAHNAQSREVWDAYLAGDPIRVPVTIYADARNWLAEPSENKSGVTLVDYLRDRQVMLDVQLRAQHWIRHTYWSDDGMGLPDGWRARVDYQNYLEASWLGAPVIYGAEPHCRPCLTDGDKRRPFDAGLPAPFSGLCGEAIERYEFFQSRVGRAGYAGAPLGGVELPFNMIGSDGPFTLACALRGASDFMLDMMDDPDYANELLDCITDAVIARIRAVRRYLGQPALGPDFGFADDAIAMLSVAQYRAFVLPRHRRMFEALSAPEAFRSMHLCGDAQRFFPTIERELSVRSFDTGFPIDFGALYEQLQPRTRVFGGVSAPLLRSGTPDAVRAETRRILASGVMQKSGAFVLREGNALSPGTPPANVAAMFEACRQYGRYR